MEGRHGILLFDCCGLTTANQGIFQRLRRDNLTHMRLDAENPGLGYASSLSTRDPIAQFDMQQRHTMGRWRDIQSKVARQWSQPWPAIPFHGGAPFGHRRQLQQTGYNRLIAKA
jgi:hypothetical protein